MKIGTQPPRQNFGLEMNLTEMEIGFRRYRGFIVIAPYQGFLKRLKGFTLSGADRDKNGMACILLKDNNAIFGGLILPGSVGLF